LDQEVSFTDVSYSDETENICFYVNSTDPEDLLVHVWNDSQGQWYALFSDLNPDSWNNITVYNTIVEGTLSIRFKGAVETGDTNQDVWEINCALIQTSNSSDNQTDYTTEGNAISDNDVWDEYQEQQQSYSFSPTPFYSIGVIPSGGTYNLTLDWNSTDWGDSEDLDIELYNFSLSGWVVLAWIDETNATSWVYSMDGEHFINSSGYVDIRFNEVGDPTQTTLKLDWIGVYYVQALIQINHARDLFDLLFLSENIYGYVGIILLLTLGLLVTRKLKVSAVLWIALFVLLGLEYLGLITATGYYSYHAIFCFVGIFLIVLAGLIEDD